MIRNDAVAPFTTEGEGPEILKLLTKICGKFEGSLAHGTSGRQRLVLCHLTPIRALSRLSPTPVQASGQEQRPGLGNECPAAEILSWHPYVQRGLQSLG